MTLLAENPVEADMRQRILVVAERLFRDIGYQKTTVADIAKTLRMSPANVYRFFDSKRSIHQGVARRLMGEVEDAGEAIVAGPGSATERMRRLLASVHRMNAERYVGDAKLHEMVAIAMEESWDVCVQHIEFITRQIAALVAEGAAKGEFHAPDVALSAGCVSTAMLRFFHPQMIAQCVDKPGPELEQMIDFLIAALRGPAPTDAAHG